MNEIVKSAWTSAVCNDKFVCVQTYSGYGGGTNADLKGKLNFLAPNASDEEFGKALLDALAHSRFVLPEPRTDAWIHPDVEFDLELTDYKLVASRYATWIGTLMERYGYKTKRALFKDMRKCSIDMKCGVITISPSHHEKPEAWGRTKGDGIEDVVIPAESTPAEIGAALRLAFSRCTG